MLLSKKTYRMVIKKLEALRGQHEKDRKDRPYAIPIDWKMMILNMIESTVRENKERWYKNLGEDVVKMLIENGKLIPYHSGCTFPNTPIPTAQEIERKTWAMLERV